MSEIMAGDKQTDVGDVDDLRWSSALEDAVDSDLCRVSVPGRRHAAVVRERAPYLTKQNLLGVEYLLIDGRRSQSGRNRAGLRAGQERDSKHGNRTPNHFCLLLCSKIRNASSVT